MTIDNFEERVKALDEAFKNASSEGFTYELPEPGTYQAVLRAVDFFEQKSSPNCAFLKIVYEVVFDPKYEGREVEMVYNLEPHKLTMDMASIEQKLGFLKRDLKTLGIDVDSDEFSLGQVRPGGEIWDTVLDVPVELQVKDSKKINESTGRPYRNAYLQVRTGDPLPKGQRPVPEGDIPAEPVAVQSAMDDDLPPF